MDKAWTFHFKIWQNETREMLTSQKLRLTAQFCLQTLIVTTHYRVFISTAINTKIKKIFDI